MILLLQLILYCLLFILLVKCAAGNSGRNVLYFYPKEYIDEAYKRGIIDDKEALMKKGKRFMIPFCIVIFAAMILIIALWNQVTDFKTAYLQSVLFLAGMNWFDGIVLDRLWVGHSKLWVIEGMEGVPYVKPWKDVLLRRGAATVLYLVFSLLTAGIVVLIGKI